MRVRLIRGLFALALLALAVPVVAGCATGAGEQVADRIRAANAVIVRDVIYRPANFLDPADIVVYLRPGATESQAEQHYCDVIVPAGGDQSDGSDVSVWDDSGRVLMAQDVTCGSASPSAGK